MEQKTLAQLFAARQAFDDHRALAPEATLTFRLYPRLHTQDFAGLELWWVEGDVRQPVPLDDHQRFVLDPSWTRADAERGAVLRTNLAEGAVAWKSEVRTPGIPETERRLGDLRLECETDLFRGNLQRGLHTPSAAIMAAAGDLCTLDDAEIYFAERPIFGVLMQSGDRVRRLPYRYVHCSDGTMTLAALFDWSYHLRDRSYYLPLEDKSWPDDTRIEFDAMDAPQPQPQGDGAAGSAATPAASTTLAARTASAAPAPTN
ncbi:MAG TPA: hypothetical protein VH328_07840 [Burkholderiaceae bacterium]|nr:hypothetical protein [Burkholderiaceae bacterium]